MSYSEDILLASLKQRRRTNLMCEPYSEDKSPCYKVGEIITRVIFYHKKFGGDMRTLCRGQSPRYRVGEIISRIFFGIKFWCHFENPIARTKVFAIRYVKKIISRVIFSPKFGVNLRTLQRG